MKIVTVMVLAIIMFMPLTVFVSTTERPIYLMAAEAAEATQQTGVVNVTNVRQPGAKAATKSDLMDAAMRELCLADGLTWKEKDVIYVGLPEGTPQCFRVEWHIFVHGGPQ